MDKIKVFALGGLDENGRDSYVIEINDDIFVIDAGIALTDKTIPGIDCILPNFDYVIKNKNRLKAYIITHGHDEDMAALKYAYKFAPAPVYCTVTTRRNIEGDAMIHHMNINFEFVGIMPSEHKIIAGRNFQFFQTCHNVANSFGVAIETDRGNIVYTGDYIVDFAVKESGYIFDLKTLEKISEKKTFLLLNESKAANKDGYCSPKHRVTSKIENYFKENKRIFVSSFWQNSFRIMEVCNLIKKYNKKVYFYDEYTRQVMNIIMPSNCGINLLPTDIVSKEDFLRVRRQDMVILILGHSGELYDQISLIAKNENADKRIALDKNDVFISCSIPTATLEVKATHSMDDLYRTGCEVSWFKSKDVLSMHARKDDIRFFLSLLKPSYYLPVRGSYTNLMENARLAVSAGVGLTHMSVFVIDNGTQLIFDDNSTRPRIVNDPNLNVEPLVVDGTGVSKAGSSIIEDRKKLGNDGVVIITATVSKSLKKIIAGPDCQMRGFVFSKEVEPLLKSFNAMIVEEINIAFAQNSFDVDKVCEIVSERASRFIRRENGRQPFIIPSIILVE